MMINRTPTVRRIQKLGQVDILKSRWGQVVYLHYTAVELVANQKFLIRELRINLKFDSNLDSNQQ